MTTIDDVLQDAANTAPEDTALARVATLVEDLLAAERALEAQRALTEKLEGIVRDLTEVRIPDAMSDAGLKKFTTTSGATVDVQDVVDVRIPSAARHDAMAWLEAHGHGGLIKSTLTAMLSKGEYARALSLKEDLERHGLTVELDQSVHAQSLKAWGKEVLAAGTELPPALFSVWTGRRAKVKAPK